MTPSLPCAKCGQVDDLERVNPLGTHAGQIVLWICRCGSTRVVAMDHHTPQELVSKARIMDEMRDRRDKAG